MTNYHDEFSRFPLDKMAQEIENMTYLFEETRVPKKHYKSLLAKQITELIEDSVEVALLDPYIKTIKSLISENEKLFFKALVAVDTGLTVSKIKSIEHTALDFTWKEFDTNKKTYGTYLSKELISIYSDVKEFGVNGFIEKLRVEGNQTDEKL